MKKKQERGGHRDGAGRKPAVDKKVQFTVYVPQSWLKIITKDRARVMCISMLESAAKNV